MNRILAAELPNHIGKEVRMVGWLHHVRALGKISFVALRDRTGTSGAG